MTDTTRPAVERMHPPEALWKYLVNPAMRALLVSPAHRLVDQALALLEYDGRRSGRHYRVPVGYRDLGGHPTVLTNSGWRVNFRGGHPLTFRCGSRIRAGTGLLEENPDAVADAYADLIDQLGWKRAGRQLGIRINVDRAPTHEELAEAVSTYGLSLLRLDLDDRDTTD